MTNNIQIAPICAKAFAPFGDLITLRDRPDKMINQGMCERHHDLADMDFGPDGRAGLSLFNAVPRDLPYHLDMMERHPDGSQAFIPMTSHPFLVVVAPDQSDAPGVPQAFVTKPGQGVNFFPGTWHGVLAPLLSPGLFAVIDRIGTTDNLQEYWFETPYIVRAR